MASCCMSSPIWGFLWSIEKDESLCKHWIIWFIMVEATSVCFKLAQSDTLDVHCVVMVWWNKCIKFSVTKVKPDKNDYMKRIHLWLDSPCEREYHCGWASRTLTCFVTGNMKCDKHIQSYIMYTQYRWLSDGNIAWNRYTHG